MIATRLRNCTEYAIRLGRMGPATLVATAFCVALVASLAGCGSAAKTSRAHPTPTGTLGRVLVVVADTDFNDSEFWALHDELVRAGYRPVVANPGGGTSTGLDDTTVAADLKLAEAEAADFAALAIIGGPGIGRSFDDAHLQQLAQDTVTDKKTLGAICLAPVVLARAGVLRGKQATVWKDNKGDLAAAGCSVQDEGVVVDGLIVTGNGPDAAQEFAQAFVTTLSSARSGLRPAADP